MDNSPARRARARFRHRIDGTERMKAGSDLRGAFGGQDRRQAGVQACRAGHLEPEVCLSEPRSGFIMA